MLGGLNQSRLSGRMGLKSALWACAKPVDALTVRAMIAAMSGFIK